VVQVIRIVPLLISNDVPLVTSWSGT